MKYFVFLMSVAFCHIPLFGQVEYTKRIEIKLADGYKNETILDFGEKGFILRSKKQGKQNGEEEWKFEKYNTDLEAIESKEISMDKKYYLDESFSSDDKHFVLFSNKKDKYLIYCIEVETMQLTKVEGRLPSKSFITKMASLGDYTFFETYLKKHPFLFAVNWKNGDNNLIPINIEGYKRKETKVLGFQVLEEHHEILLYVITLDSRKKSDLHVLTLNDQGEKTGSFNLTKNIAENIADISGSKLGENQYLFTGTYSKTSVSMSQGLFFCQSTQNKVDFIEFYNFLDLAEFLSYLPEKKEARIEKRKARKESKGKELKFNYSIAAHEIREIHDGYIFIGEAFYRTYRMERYTVYETVNGVSRPSVRTRAVFDGNQYTHAVIAKFDKKGKLIWDHSIEMFQLYKPYYVKKFIKVHDEEDSTIKLVYSSNFKLVSKYINYNGEIEKEQESEEIELGFDNDRLRWSHTNLSYWYEDYFLVSGRQKIKNLGDKSVKRKRRVMFMNKVKYL